jgi:FkbM family methyltransferase
MKRLILGLANVLLRPFNAKVVSIETDDFGMSSAVRRIAEHRFAIRTIIDIGASDGRWSLNTMKIFPDSTVLAIEPLKERLGALEDCRQKYVNFDYELCAAGESDGDKVTLNVSNDLDGSTVDGTGGESRQIQIRTIDSIVSERKLKGPFLMKFDTHGYEIPILNGAEETLKKAEVVIMEVYNFQITNHALRFHEMCFEMERMGFRCYDIAGPMFRIYDKSFWQMDLFFCRKDSEIFCYSNYR